MDSPWMELCGGQLWVNTSLVLDEPETPPCFVHTVVTWVVLGVFWVFLPFHVTNTNSYRRDPAPLWSRLYASKIVLVVLLVATSVAEVVVAVNHYLYIPGYAPIISSSLKLTTYVFILILMEWERRAGVVSSLIQFIFWLLHIIYSSILVYSYRQTARQEWVVLACVELGVVIFIFMFNCIGEEHPEDEENKNCCPEYSASWLSRATFWWMNGSGQSLFWVLARLYGPELFKAHACKLICDGLAFVGPYLQRLLITFTTDTSQPVVWGYVYSALFFLTALTNAFFFQHLYHIGLKLGMRIRSAITAAVYKKAMRLSNDSRSAATIGEIVNLMSIDAQRLQDVTGYLWMVWSSPLQVIVCIYLLWDILGPSVIGGLVVMVALIPLNVVIAAFQKRYQVGQMKQKDKRIKMMSEVLGAMKVLKLNAWESHFQDRVTSVRDLELDCLRKFSYLAGAGSFSWTIATFLVMLATLTTYVMLGNVLTPEVAFVSLTLFNILYFPINLFPQVISLIVTTSVSIKRLGSFLLKSERDMDVVTHKDNGDPITIENGTFAWGSNKLPVLNGLNVRISQGEFVAVVGTVGAGKSSLLSAILGNMDKLNGQVTTSGSIAYVTQQAWIQNTTVRENILFGQTFDQSKYYRVVSACALEPDFETLPAGDQTEIGEKGVNLSGGQKQRVAVARALYAAADIYLLDDPLSAVDAHVGKHLFEQVLGPAGMLAGKTRVLVTHGLQWLPAVDRIIVVEDSTITHQGSYHDLIKDGGHVADLLLSSDHVISSGEPDQQSGTESLMGETEAGKIKKEKLGNGQGGLLTEEKTAVGEVKWSVFVTYARALGLRNALTLVLSYTFYRVASVLTNFWLTQWTSDVTLLNETINQASSHYLDTRDWYLSIYGVHGVLQAVFILVYALVSAVAMVRAAGRLHDNMLHNILRAPMTFFDTTPSGRIINRFSRDVDTIDSVLPTLMRNWMNTFFIVLSSFLVIAVVTPLFLVVAVPLLVMYIFIQKFYIPTSRQLKRLESTTRSPIYEHFAESIAGGATIQAFGQMENFQARSNRYMDNNLVYYFSSMSANRWLGLRLDLLSACVVLSTCVFGVVQRSSLSGSFVGLTISYALQVTTELNWMVRVTSDLESNVVSVERVKEYTEIPPEAPWVLEGPKPGESWPARGGIKFEGYSTRYRPGLDLALSNINIDINPGEKIGIVGRTGSGKSSLTQALLRIIESVEGQILIDEVDIALLGLHHLRSAITILPQEPTLFGGSIRMNLDPTGSCEDSGLWRALEKVHLKTYFEDLGEGLDYDCGENGQNLSVGQQQLVCFARALLKRSRILVLDEATAAVDMETDAMVQQLINTEFKHATVLIIAHRLPSILSSDRVLVMSEGSVAEIDTPQSLLDDPTSMLHALAVDAGII